MRIMVFFDLPVESYKQQKDYRKFHKFLLSSGYIMMQKSIYCKLALNNSIVNSEKQKLIKNKPNEGIVQVLVITEKQFAQMEFITGKKNTNTIDTDQRMIII